MCIGRDRRSRRKGETGGGGERERERWSTYGGGRKRRGERKREWVKIERRGRGYQTCHQPKHGRASHGIFRSGSAGP